MGIFNRKEKQPSSETGDPSLFRIKTAIQSMKQNRGSEKELRDSIYECFASGKWVHMITLGEKDGMQRLDVRPGKGGGLIAWYTGPEEIKQGKCDLFITDINILIEPMYSSRDIIGMVINPDTDGLVITKSYLLAIVILFSFKALAGCKVPASSTVCAEGDAGKHAFSFSALDAAMPR